MQHGTVYYGINKIGGSGPGAGHKYKNPCRGKGHDKYDQRLDNQCDFCNPAVGKAGGKTRDQGHCQAADNGNNREKNAYGTVLEIVALAQNDIHHGHNAVEDGHGDKSEKQKRQDTGIEKNFPEMHLLVLRRTASRKAHPGDAKYKIGACAYHKQKLIRVLQTGEEIQGKPGEKTCKQITKDAGCKINKNDQVISDLLLIFQDQTENQGEFRTHDTGKSHTVDELAQTEKYPGSGKGNDQQRAGYQQSANAGYFWVADYITEPAAKKRRNSGGNESNRDEGANFCRGEAIELKMEIQGNAPDADSKAKGAFNSQIQ